ncbi:hypothetical protein ACOMHN_039488 [Nucella lapillus]
MTVATTAAAIMNIVLNLQSFPLFVLYLLMVAVSGIWKRNVPPVANLRPLLIVHNFACCLASIFSLGGFTYCILQSGSLYSRETSSILTGFFTLYWLTKVIELLDTVFMILRHKVRQISFLHVYHHSSMLLLSDLAAASYPWPAIAVYLAMNSFVHIVLYSYYGLTAFNPDKPPTWKKEMTQIQIVQFFIGFVIAGYGYWYHNYCVFSFLYGITMTWLFSNFYYQAYVKKRPVKQQTVQNAARGNSGTGERHGGGIAARGNSGTGERHGGGIAARGNSGTGERHGGGIAARENSGTARSRLIATAWHGGT